MKTRRNEIERSFGSKVGSLASQLFYAGVFLALSVSVLPEAWALDATPTSLSFTAVQGGTNPPNQIINVLVKNNRRVVSLSSSDNATWLNVSPATGTMTSSAQLTVSVNSAGLAVGIYSGMVTVTASKGGNVSIPVTLTVTAGTSTPPPTSKTSATLSWSSNPETDVVGYKVYMGTASRVYSSTTTVGKVTSYTVSNLKLGTTYYFAVTAYDASGNESTLSGEVSKSIY